MIYEKVLKLEKLPNLFGPKASSWPVLFSFSQHAPSSFLFLHPGRASPREAQ
jgi:hypothetical protein